MTALSRELALAALLLSVAGCTQPRPNVLLVVVDTLRADHLGAYGYTRPTSPRLDALAERGVRFARAYAPSSWTAPSVASILTGLYPAAHGVEQSTSVLAAGIPSMPEAFRAAGYATAAFSANPVFVCPRVGFDRGFETFEVLNGPPVGRDTPVAMIPVDPRFRSFVEVAKADVVTDRALAWLAEEERAGRPWFLLLHYIDPHADYFPPPEFAARFGVRPGARYSGVDQRPLLRSYRPPPAAEDLATLVGLYDGEIAFTDLHVGRLLDAVGGRGERTLVVVTADHGEEFGEHGRLLHTMTLFEEQLHVPLIVAGAGLPRGHVVDTPVSLVGLWATIASLAGQSPPPSEAGAPFTALARGGEEAAQPLFADLDKVSPGIPQIHRRAVLEDPWKLIAGIDDSKLLFDLGSDPNERRDLGSSEAKRLAKLGDILARRDRVAAEARVGAAPATVILSPEDKARMRALGYLD